MSEKLKVGAAREIITPKIGSVLAGYMPARTAEKVNDDLTVTAAAFEYGGKQALILSATVCIVDDGLFDCIKERITLETGVPQSNIILAATHTHSGPMNSWMPKDTADKAYNDSIFIPRTVKAAKNAVASLKPALMGIGTAHSEVGVNRRQLNLDGSVSLGQNPWGCYDPTMTVIAFKSQNGEPILNIVHYCAHCTGAHKNPEITRDWPGPMIDRLEQQSRAVTMFVNGAEGDVGPRLSNGKTVGDLSLALELGARAALDAVSAFRSIKEYAAVQMNIIVDEIKLQYAPLIPLEDAKAEMAMCQNPDELRDWKLMHYNHLKEVVAEYDSGNPFKEHMCLPQTIIRIGSVVFVPFPFEMFAEIALRLREYSPFAHTLSLSNANGYVSYLPSQDQLCRGGYEVNMFRMTNLYNLRDDTDNHIIAENLRILEKLG